MKLKILFAFKACVCLFEKRSKKIIFSILPIYSIKYYTIYTHHRTGLSACVYTVQCTYNKYLHIAHVLRITYYECHIRFYNILKTIELGNERQFRKKKIVPNEIIFCLYSGGYHLWNLTQAHTAWDCVIKWQRQHIFTEREKEIKRDRHPQLKGTYWSEHTLCSTFSSLFECFCVYVFRQECYVFKLIPIWMRRAMLVG